MSSTAARVIPSGQAAAVGVPSRPALTRNRFVALVSATNPRWSSITASSAPAAFASILARIDGSRLLWWIFGSRQSGCGRRMLEVIRVIPARSYTGGLCSASTIRVGPDRFSRGSIPLVTFSPRVSVSLMCTLSVIWLACRVRRICPVISSSEGTVSNASAFAERRNRPRCSVSRKMRPRYRRRPSQTASPPCTAESNGLTAASSRWVRRPPTFTMTSRLRSSRAWSTVPPSLPAPLLSRGCSLAGVPCRCFWPPSGPGGDQALGVQPLVVRPAPLGQGREPGRQRLPGRVVGPEPGGPPHAVIPVRAPHPVGVPRPGRPRQHRRGEADAQRRAQRAQYPLGVLEQVTRVDHGTGVGVEDLRLLHDPQVGQGWLRPDLGVRGEQFGRVPEQVGVPQGRQRRPVHLGQQMVGHVLAVVHALARRERRRGEVVEHLAPAVGHAGQDLVPAGVADAGPGKVERVQRLVGHDGVRPVAERPHERGRDGARAGPHRDPGYWLGQSFTTERSTSPRCILAKESSMPSSVIVSETNFSSGSRPCRYSVVSMGKSRSGRQSPYQEDFSAPPRPNRSSSGSSICISGVGTPTWTSTPARSLA